MKISQEQSQLFRDDPEKPPVLTYPGSLTIDCIAAIDATDDESQSLRIQWIGPSKLRWHLESEDGSAGELRIYSARGRLVTVLGRQPSEEAVSYLWDCCDRSGRKVVGGIYFYEIMSGERRFTGKVHIPQ